MRTLTVLEHLSLDGVIQGPGGVDEDRSGGFDRGGWTGPFGDEALGRLVRAQMTRDFDLVLGRKTYDIWAPYWPMNRDIWPQACDATKYVASTTLKEGSWGPCEVWSREVVDQVRKLKMSQGRELHTWGSATLVQYLLAHDLVDRLWLMVYPVVVGQGRRLFAEGPTQAFVLVDSQTTPKGVTVQTYERRGS